MRGLENLKIRCAAILAQIDGTESKGASTEMSLTVLAECSNHQARGWGRTKEITIDNLDFNAQDQVKRELENDGWVVQFNGDNMDTYCSKECAR